MSVDLHPHYSRTGKFKGYLNLTPRYSADAIAQHVGTTRQITKLVQRGVLSRTGAGLNSQKRFKFTRAEAFAACVVLSIYNRGIRDHASLRAVASALNGLSDEYIVQFNCAPLPKLWLSLRSDYGAMTCALIETDAPSHDHSLLFSVHEAIHRLGGFSEVRPSHFPFYGRLVQKAGGSNE